MNDSRRAAVGWFIEQLHGVKTELTDVLQAVQDELTPPDDMESDENYEHLGEMDALAIRGFKKVEFAPNPVAVLFAACLSEAIIKFDELMDLLNIAAKTGIDPEQERQKKLVEVQKTLDKLEQQIAEINEPQSELQEAVDILSSALLSRRVAVEPVINDVSIVQRGLDGITSRTIV